MPVVTSWIDLTFGRLNLCEGWQAPSLLITVATLILSQLPVARVDPE